MKKKPAVPPVAADLHRKPSPLLRAALIVAVYLFAFIILDFITHQYEELSGVVSWYPPAGLTYALLLVFGLRFTPAVTIALLIDSVFIYHMPQPIYLLLLWSLVISLIYGAAAAFLRHVIRFDWQLRKFRDVIWFVFAALLVSALLAVLSVSSVTLGSDITRNEVFHAIFHWWIGETVGVLTVTPFLLIHVMPRLKRFTEGQPLRLPARWSFPRPTLSVIGQALSLAFTLYWVFGVRVLDEFQPLFLISLPLIWIALQHGFKGVTVGIVVSNFGVMLALWFFRSDLANLGELQLLMIVNCVIGLLMGAVVTERKQAEGQIRYQATLLFNVSDAIIATDEQYNIKLWNMPAETQYGWKEEEVIGRPMREFIQNVYMGDSLDVILKKISEVGNWKGEVTQNRRDGTRFPVLSSLSSVKDHHGTLIGFISVNRDITQRKQAEQALAESENKFRWLYEYAPIVYHILTPDGIITDVNRRWCQVLDYSREEVLGKEIFDFIVEEERKTAKASFMHKKAGKQTFVEGSERNYLTKAGVVRTFKTYDFLVLDQSQNITSIQTTLEDITERKQVEEDVKEKLNELQRWHDVTLGRETYILDLKREVNELLDKASQPPRYPSAESQEDLEK